MSSSATKGTVSKPQRLLVLLCAAQFLNVVNLSSVTIALPDIAAELNFGAATLQWVVSAYALTFGGFLLLGGRLADLKGRRKILCAGFAVFAVFALVDAFAASPQLLIAARAMQGIGAAITVPAALGILSDVFTEDTERSRALASFAAAGAIGLAAGLILGGGITEVLGWRWVFGITALLPVAFLVLSFMLVPPDSESGSAEGHIDAAGALTATAGLLGVVFALTNASDAGWGAPATIGALVTGIVLLGAFLRLQARVPEPLMPLRLWRLPNFAGVIAVAFCLYASWAGVNFFLTLTIRDVLGYSPSSAALALLPLAIGGWICSTIAGRVLPHTGPKLLIMGGLALLMMGTALMATIHGDTSYWPHIFPATVLAVAGVGFTFVSCNIVALAHAPQHEEALVGGLFNAGLQVGNGLGLAVLTVVASMQTSAGTSGAALLPGYQAAFWAALSIAALGLLVAVFGLRGSAHHAPPAKPGAPDLATHT